MSVAIISGSGGLIGAEAARFFGGLGFQVVGIDNNMRKEFFGEEASTAWAVQELRTGLPSYMHYSADIRDGDALDRIFAEYGSDVALVIHTAAQPSHDWAAGAPLVDFGVNALGTLNMLESTRRHAPNAVFIFTSTNKVYGDTPNRLPLVELETRFEIQNGHEYERGITETMSIDACTHSVFGASKVAADVMVQEYGRYFGMKTVCFRGGCLTGPGHSGAELHGFLAYLMKCCVAGRTYRIFGYKGKQVRDNIHSYDLIQAFHAFYKEPRVGEVYNIGGGTYSNCSMNEAIALCETISGKRMRTVYVEENRIGDHIWWVSGLQKFEEHFPEWKITYDVPAILREVYEANTHRAEPATA
ncbi:MAG: NAD-dependent epimerase/dehydratase family protein [Candidatus Hydrogenedentales bacterium]|jgi:CDP-paratose 2-epimerase